MKINRTDKGEPIDEHSWPKHKVDSVQCRKRDLVIRITDWTKDRDEPAFDVEVYNRGIYDWNESQCFLTRNAGKTRKQAKAEAIKFAQEYIQKALA